MRRPARLLLPALLWLCCEPPPAAPPPPGETRLDPAPTAWSLAGRVTGGAATLPDAPPFEGGAAAIARCEAAVECAAERWRAEGGSPPAERILLRDGDRIVWLDDQTVWPARWRQISGALLHCLGDPLAVPPAADPAGGRDLLEDPTAPQARWWWRIRLSGQNRCDLRGSLRVAATAPKIDLSELRVGDLPWHSGGRQRAEAHLRAELRELARTSWDALPEAEQADLLRALRADPEASAWVAEHDRRAGVSAP